MFLPNLTHNANTNCKDLKMEDILYGKFLLKYIKEPVVTYINQCLSTN